MSAKLEIKKAIRRAVALQVGFYGPTGSGKTFSALRFAAGLAGPDGKVAVIDTEKGRASLYADNKRLLAELPQGYSVVDLDDPYHPERFIEALELCESAGNKVCLIDSESDSWDGPGGCHDITANNKGRWNKAKLANKKMKTWINLSDMHVISLFKAQEKSKIIEGPVKNGKKTEEVISLGVLPISERNAFYPMLLGFSVDPKTHLSEAIKCHDDLTALFQVPKMITKEDGDRVRIWNESGQAVDYIEQLFKRSRFAAGRGTEAYKAYFSGLSAKQRKDLAAVHEENKQLAAQADREAIAEATADDATELVDEPAAVSGDIPSFGSPDQPVPFPDTFDGPVCLWNGERYELDLDSSGYRKVAA